MPAAVQPILPALAPADDSVELVLRRLPAKDLVSVADIASACDLSAAVVYAWIDSGALPALPLGSGEKRSHRKISRNTFRRFLEARKAGAL